MTTQDDLVGLAEITELLAIASPQQANTLSNRPDFPAPIADLRRGRIWKRADIERWALTWDRRPGPKPREPRDNA